MALYAQIDCSFPDRPDVAEVGDLAELVYMRAVLRCRDNLTDGVIDRRVISRWFAGIRGKTVTHLEKLVNVGLLNNHPDGWCIPLEVWTKWNPTKADVQAKRAAEVERVRAYRERNKPVRTDLLQREYAQPKPEPKPKPKLVLAPKPRERDPIWDAMVQHVGDVATKPEQSRRGKIVNELKAAGATPEQIASRCSEYKQRWPKMSLTDTALVKHWSALEATTGPRRRADGLIVTGSV